jgi:hypothetical protein
MELFKTAKVTLALDTLRIRSADDRWGGVEPYVVPIFFKVDGERYLASLRILHARPPREGSGEQPGGVIQISVDTVDSDTLPSDAEPDIQEDNPLIWVPPGKLLGRGTLDAGEQIVMRDVSFTSELIPIPFRIDVAKTYMSATEAFQALLVPLQGALSGAINSVFLNVDDFIGDLFGLDEVLERCPATDLGSSDFLKDIDAHFKAMIPGTIGGVFVCMENDAFDESLARDLRSSVKEEVAYVINHVVNGLNENNLVADVDFVTDQTPSDDNIGSDLMGPVISDIGLSVASALSGDVAFGLYGILTGLSWLAGGPDDPIGVVTVSFDHSDLGPVGSHTIASQILTTEDEDDDNSWELSYTMTVHSIA